MGYWVRGKTDATIIAITAKDAHDAAERAKELLKRGAQEIHVRDEHHMELTLEEVERVLRGTAAGST